MMDFMENIRGRRSIRKYEDKKIPEDVLAQVLEAVQWSPSWANSQCWEIVIVEDPVIREQLQMTAKGNPASKAMLQAPVLIALCAKVTCVVRGTLNPRLKTVRCMAIFRDSRNSITHLN